MSKDNKNTTKADVLPSLLLKKELVGGVIACIAAFFLFPYYFETFIFPIGAMVPDFSMVTDINKVYPWYSLDPSWTVALNKFNVDHLVWGKDVTFTYGPLAYLATRVGWGVNKYYFILFDLFVWVNFFFIFYTAWVKSENRKIVALLIAATCIFLPSAFSSGIAIVLLAFLVFWARQCLEESKVFYYVMQIVIIWLLFFIKFNSGLISLFFFLLIIGYKLLFTKEKKIPLFLYLIALTALIFIFAKIFNVALLEYLQGGLNAVSGYNEIMYADNPHGDEYKYTYAIMALSLSLLVIKIYLERKKLLLKNLVTLCLFSISFYLLYKQAFVRNDTQHTLDISKFALLFIVVIPDFYYTRTTKFSYWILAGIIFLLFLFSKKREDRLFKLNERVFKTAYVKGFANFSDSSGLRIFPNNNQIPDSIKTKIAGGTVDIFPWNIHLLLENKLNYKARPAFQSYFAYTPFFEDLNFNFYNSDSAPEFVFFDMETIDSRYSLFDETKVNLLLLKNYSYLSYFNFNQRPTLVLKKKAKPTKITFQKVREFEMNSLDAIQPKEGSYYELFIKSSIKGTLTSLVDHSPEIYLVIKTKDGMQREFRTSKKLLESGIFSNRFYNSTLDVFNQLVNNEKLKPETEVIEYSIRYKVPACFSKKIKVIEYKIN